MDEFDSFPWITFILASMMLGAFLVTCPKFCVNSDPRYESTFAFIPANPKIFSFVTYIFIHGSVDHLLGNLIFLFIGGLVIEQTLGRWIYLSVFISSANIAVIFDIIGRFISGISFSVPFIGSSGAIFGIVFVAALLKPMEKMHSIFLILAILPLIISFLFPLIGTFSANGVTLFVSPERIIILMTVVSIFIFLLFKIPTNVPLVLVLGFFLLDWLVFVLFRVVGSSSYVGHLGGVMGGIISFFIFAGPKHEKK